MSYKRKLISYSTSGLPLVFPPKNLIGINNNFDVRSENISIFLRTWTLKHAVFAHASPVFKAVNPSQLCSATFPSQKGDIVHFLNSNGQWNQSQKENRHKKHHLPSCSVVPSLIKSISVSRFGLNVWAEFRLCSKSKQCKRKTIFRRFKTSNPPCFTAD